MAEQQLQSVPQKGPFWLVCEIDDNGNIAVEKLIAFPVNSYQAAPSHKNIWDACRGSIKKLWNYYPRGRVEVKKDKAVVYANSYCFEYIDLPQKLRAAFNLGDLPLELKADNSAHYTDGVFGERSFLRRRKNTARQLQRRAMPDE